MPITGIPKEDQIFISENGELESPLAALNKIAIWFENKRNTVNNSSSEIQLTNALLASIKAYIKAPSKKLALDLYNNHFTFINSTAKGTNSLVNNYENLLREYKAFEFIEALPETYDLQAREARENFVIGQEFRSQFYESLEKSQFKRNLLLPLNQDSHPLIENLHGFCFGIALGGAFSILKENKFFEKNLPSKGDTVDSTQRSLSSTNFQFIERLQNSQSFEKENGEIINPHNEPLNIHPAEFFKDEYGNPADINIGNGIKSLFEEVADSNKNSVVELGFITSEEIAQVRGDNVYHSTAILKKDKLYYFIDANVGVFEFDNIDEMANFIQWATEKTLLTTAFEGVFINSFPQLETEVPTPAAWKERARKVEQYINKCKDWFENQSSPKPILLEREPWVKKTRNRSRLR